MSPDLAIIEEASHTRQEIFKTVIAPVMGINNMSLLAISTPSEDANNYYSYLLEAKSSTTGQMLFKSIRIGLACEPCTEEGLGASCTHMARVRVPPWKDESRNSFIMDVYGDDKDLYAREILGTIAIDRKFLFKKKWVSAARNAERVSFGKTVKMVYTCIDPSCGGTQSGYACMTAAYDDGRFVILGVDCEEKCIASDVEERIHGHFQNIRNTKLTANSVIVLIMEANSSWIDVDRVHNIAMQYEPIHVISKDSTGRGRKGVFLDKHLKQLYFEDLRRAFQKNLINVYRNVRGKEIEKDIKAMWKQVQVVRLEVDEKPDNPFKKARTTITGKSAGQQDDMAITLAMCVFWSRFLQTDVQFINYKRAAGLL